MTIEKKIEDIRNKIGELYSELATIAVDQDIRISVDCPCSYTDQTAQVVTPSFYQELINRGYAGDDETPFTEGGDVIEIGSWISSSALC